MGSNKQETSTRQPIAPVTFKHGNKRVAKTLLQRFATLIFATTVCVTGTASAAAPSNVDSYLKTQQFVKTLPGGETTPMWGFASCPDNTFTGCTLDAPGPQIEAFTGYNLNIHVKNTLNVPVSVMIPGQVGAGNPTFDTDMRTRQRVHSLTQEVAPGATGLYSWPAATLRTGTYLYQSASHPSIQVPMGLYGSLVVHPATSSTAATSCAANTTAINATYDNRLDSCYKTEATLLLSEIDPVQNAAVDAAVAVTGYPSTMHYNPTYLLVNGQGSNAGALPAGNPGDKVLLRILNAGLDTHNPSIVGLELGMLAEDGNPHPGTIKLQSVAMLAAGKTLDVLATLPTTDVTLSLYDRKPTFSNNVLNALPGGVAAMGQLKVGLGSPTPPPVINLAIADTYAVTEDTPLTISAVTGLLSNDSGLSGATVALAPFDGTIALNADGSFIYTPNAEFSGTDHFTYKASDLNGNTYAAQVTLNISFVNDIPVATADTYSNNKGGTLTVPAPGVLGNDKDADGDTLTAVLDTTPAGLTFNADGSFTMTAAAGLYTFTYHAVDATTASSTPVSVTLDIKPASGIAMTVQEPNGTAVTAYRWTVEEDRMWFPDPALPQADSLATNFHRSYMPVIAQGCVDPTAGSIDCPNPFPLSDATLDPSKHYYVSVLPFDAASGVGGHTIGGSQIVPNATSVTVNVNLEPMGYAQINALIFDDNNPTNGVQDGVEPGLGGFTITLEDGGGRYGMASGLLSKDANGNPLKNYLDCFGTTPPPAGIIISCPDTPANQLAGLVGRVWIKNVFPGKYGLIATPPANAQYTDWVQTSTIEGTKINDVWVKAGEPAFFTEFGPPGWHMYVGFTSPSKIADYVAANNFVGSNTIRGAVTNNHMSRSPSLTLFDSGTYDALAHTRPWVSLNSAGGIGQSLAVVHATMHADGTATFEIPNVPDGSYQVAIWDDYLDTLTTYSHKVTVQGGQIVELGNIPAFNWFARLESSVFVDINENGKRDPGEIGIPEVPVNLRWRDGSMYQSVPTDGSGDAPFDEMFPFFNWLVAEVDYASYKATGMTAVVDHGGDVLNSPVPFKYLLNPQVQADGTTSRTETGAVLTQGIQNFLGQTATLEWGKAPYKDGENGGITGVVYYSVTRAEGDPRLGLAEPWEPGIPDVKVRLYRERNKADGSIGLALVDETVTDNWEKNEPTGCPGADPSDPVTPIDKCYDGLRNFNQIRPATFDGGYAFGRAAGKPELAAGKYVVEIVPPAGYNLVKEEDVNVTFGETFGSVSLLIGGYPIPTLPDLATLAAARAPVPGLTQPACVGATHTVQPYLSLFPSEMADAPFAGATRPLCDRKEVTLANESQAAADFFLYTATPIAGQFTGIILDDTAQEFDPLSPQFGEKWAPPFVPVALLDPLGNEISRIYSDQWGAYNGLLPSTFSASMPSPSGFSPAMVMTCMNHPGPIADPNGGTQKIIDPQYNPMYSTFCYTMQYMPGTTTYLDTPVLPVAAYAAGFYAPSCAADTQTPMIREVNGTGAGPLVAPGGTLTITSMGSTNVPNPDYAGPRATSAANMSKTITRDFGFGAVQGTGTVSLNGQTVTVTSWSDAQITLTLPATFTPGDYQLVVTRGILSSTEAITVTVGNETPIRVASGGSIQNAIDTANPGALILVDPGTYVEALIMWKPVRLQGAGAGSTVINAVKTPVGKIQDWRDKMDALFALGVVSAGSNAFGVDEGAGITVTGLNTNNAAQGAFSKFASRIDGFSITGADVGGGIFVEAHADNIMISNNHIFGNTGTYGGGISIGRPFAQLQGIGPFGLNKNIQIVHNAITQNAARGGAGGGGGGGVSINTGSDRYSVSSNFICGNYASANGGGISHFGISDNGTIARNKIVLNQSFQQGKIASGGGVFISGERQGGGLTPGAGSVTLDANFIQANQAASGHGGGIRTEFINGKDVTLNGGDENDSWYQIKITNNMIVNNLAGWSGAGISMQDTLNGVITDNTIVHNDSTATVAGAFSTGNINVSAPQPAGISVEPNSPALDVILAATGGDEFEFFSKPVLRNNIIWQNRAFHYDATTGRAKIVPELTQATVGACDPNANYWDLGVIGAVGTLNPKYSVLTSTVGYHKSNKQGDPKLIGDYCNGGRRQAGPMLPFPATDEGGNTWIDLRFGPLTAPVQGDYHIGPLSSALDSANKHGSSKHDFDGEPRPQPNNKKNFDIGADETPLTLPTATMVLSFTSSATATLKKGGTKLDFGKRINPNGPAIITTLTLTVANYPVDIGQLSIRNKRAANYAIVAGADTCSNTTVAIGGACTVQISLTPAGPKRRMKAKFYVPTNLFVADLKLTGKKSKR